MRRPALLAAATAAVLAAGCGTPSADLFVIERSGELPDARVTMVIGDGGAVECDGTERSMSNDRLLEARELADDLAPLLDRRLRLPVPDAALLRYRILGEGGEIRFADASPRLPPELGRLVRFSRAVATEACGLER